MATAPTLKDFDDLLSLSARKAAADGKEAIGQIIYEASRVGRLGSSSCTDKALERARSAIITHAEHCFREASRRAGDTDLAVTDLFEAASIHLAGFSTVVRDYLAPLETYAMCKPLVIESFSKIEESVNLIKRQAELGWGTEHHPMATFNQINAETVIGAQQGGSHSTFTASTSATLDRTKALEALKELEDAISKNQYLAGLADLTADIASIRAQLSKANPPPTLLRALANNVQQGIVSGLAGAAAPALFSSLQLLISSLG